ncbi:CT214 family putative inclusion membrane protein [Chlamydia vaughanii]|uniref:CT214 family putative inclusion membrane protein n=1 Tax=Chlamydia vaughanii TaxID=3112552 RepID=UPI0032B23146
MTQSFDYSPSPLSRNFLERKYDQNSVPSMAQTISLVSGVIAAVLLATLCLIQIVPGLPIAFNIVLATITILSLAVSLTAFAIHCIQKRREYIEDRQLPKDEKEGELDVSLEERPKIEPEKIEVVTPPVFSKEYLRWGSKVFSEDELKDLSLPNRLEQLLDLYRLGGQYPSMEVHPKYSKYHAMVTEKFSHICNGLIDILKKTKKEGNRDVPLNWLDIGMVFLNPLILFSNVRPVLLVTSNTKDILKNENFGAFWLHDILKDLRLGYSLIGLLETIKNKDETKGDYCSCLKFINCLLAGWCLSDPHRMQNIVGSVQSLSISEEKKHTILKLFSKGNVIGALFILHKDADSKWNNLLTVYKKQAEYEEEVLEETHLSIKDLDIVSSMRQMFASGDLFDSSEDRGKNIFLLFQGLFTKLSKNLPLFVTGFVREYHSKERTPSKAVWEEILKALEKNPPHSMKDVFSITHAAFSVPGLPKRLKSYLPHGTSGAFKYIFSNIILGGYALGLVTKKQFVQFIHMMGVPREHFISALYSKNILRFILQNKSW